MRRGTNLPAVGGFNQSVVLDLVRRAGEGISRVEIAEASGLSPQTVSNLTRRLLADGLVRESGKRIAGPGKPRTILTLDPRGGYAVGVHLDPSVVTYVLTDLEGRVVLDRRVRTPRQVQPEAVVTQMAQTIGALVEASGVAADRVLGVGIAAPGPIDRETGTVLDPPLLVGWHRVPLRAALAERLGLPVGLEKDVTAAATAELWSPDGISHPHQAFFYYGTGVGLGVALDGEVVRGSSANAGDIGHLMVRGDGAPCTCGRRGCLGENASPARMVREAADLGVLELPARELGLVEVDRAFTRLSAAAAREDPHAVTILRRTGRDIGRALVIVANLLDIDTVVCGGPFWDRLAPVALPEVRRVVDGDPAVVTTHPVRVLETALGSDVTALGAAALVLDAVHSPRPAGLLITAP